MHILIMVYLYVYMYIYMYICIYIYIYIYITSYTNKKKTIISGPHSNQEIKINKLGERVL